ncbi:MAG TPA: hypothetical protein VFH89_12295 [Sphingomicrobium sp.]|nr:hypothetical protein [Sphingomicrobium sp.]
MGHSRFGERLLIALVVILTVLLLVAFSDLYFGWSSAARAK